MFALFALLGVNLAAHADVNYDSAGHVLTLTEGEHTLASVSKALNTPEVLTYDAEKHIAWCRASLAIGPGATLRLNHEVLRMDCPKGEFAITVQRKEKNLGVLVLTDSVIAPKDVRSFYQWDVQGKLECRQSEIVGASCLFLRAAAVTLDDVIIESFGHHNRDTYSPFYAQSAGRLAIQRLTILDGGNYALHLQTTATSRDSFIEGTAYVRTSGRWEAINTACRGISIQEYQGQSGHAWRKWYLDVGVVDAKGRPVPGATVEVTNDTAADKYPPQNQAGEKLASATTADGTGRTPAGHTPLPSEDAAHSFVLTDYHQFSEGNTPKFEFDTDQMTYTVRVSKLGYSPAEIVVDPNASWYRPDQDKPTNTVVVSLAKGAGRSRSTQAKQPTAKAKVKGPRVSTIRLLYNNLGPQETKDAVEQWLARAAEGKFTVVTYPIGVFRQEYVPRERPAKPFDPIACFVAEAHRRKMRVFAWWAGFFTQKTAQEKGFTLPVNADGKTPNLNYGSCPNDPAFRALIRQFLTEFLSAYDFDGISYDDGYGYPPGDVCYCDNCVRKFQKEAGEDPSALAHGPQTFSRGELAHFRGLRKTWAQWRTQQVTEFAGFVRDTARRLKPRLTISTSGSATPGDWRFYDQVACLKAGTIDYYEPELYFATANAAQRMQDGLAKWREAMGEEIDNARVSPIVYGWMRKPVRGKDADLPKTGEELLAEVRAIEAAGMSLGFFDDRVLTVELLAALATGAPPGKEIPEKFRRSSGKFNILLRGFVDDARYREFLDLFRSRGAAVKWYNGLLTPELLSQFDLYIELPLGVYTDAEAEALTAFAKNGGRVFLMGGDYQNGCVEANVFLSSFGLRFTGGCGSPVFEKASDHPLTVGLTKVHCLGGTGIEAKDPALGLLRAGETVGLACWVGEKGRILILCDEWPLASFGNDEENLRSTKYDHRRLAENIVEWLVSP